MKITHHTFSLYPNPSIYFKPANVLAEVSKRIKVDIYGENVITNTAVYKSLIQI